jgi:hypothetical protein
MVMLYFHLWMTQNRLLIDDNNSEKDKNYE